MLGHDEREERLADGLGLELLHAEEIKVLESVLRGEGDESALGESRRKSLVSVVFPFADDIQRSAFKPVLTNDDGTLFSRSEVKIFWQG